MRIIAESVPTLYFGLRNRPLSVGEVVDFLYVFQNSFEIYTQVFQPAGADIEHPAVDGRIMLVQIAFLDFRHFDDVDALFLNVQFDQTVVAYVFVVNRVQLFAVQPVHIADVAQPRVQRAVVAGLHGGFDAAAVVVSADDDVFDFQMIDRVADHAG